MVCSAEGVSCICTHQRQLIRELHVTGEKCRASLASRAIAHSLGRRSEHRQVSPEERRKAVAHLAGNAAVPARLCPHPLALPGDQYQAPFP